MSDNPVISVASFENFKQTLPSEASSAPSLLLWDDELLGMAVSSMARDCLNEAPDIQEAVVLCTNHVFSRLSQNQWQEMHLDFYFMGTREGVNKEVGFVRAIKSSPPQSSDTLASLTAGPLPEVVGTPGLKKCFLSNQDGQWVERKSLPSAQAANPSAEKKKAKSKNSVSPTPPKKEGGDASQAFFSATDLPRQHNCLDQYAILGSLARRVIRSLPEEKEIHSLELVANIAVLVEYASLLDSNLLNMSGNRIISLSNSANSSPSSISLSSSQNKIVSPDTEQPAYSSEKSAMYYMEVHRQEERSPASSLSSLRM